MFGIESATLDAAVVIGLVLIEALVLYVGYGVLSRALGPRVTRLIRGE